MLVGALLAAAMIALNDRLGPNAVDAWPHLFGAGASGARGLLETIASSMITVAGVVFSITLVALSQASSQYTPRVLRNFMRDRGNQVVLGAFVGIFMYCLIVLRTIRSGDEGTFVPTIAVFGGLVLGSAGIGVLIYFIHHISTLIQASNILDAIAADTTGAIDDLFPLELDDGEAGNDAAPPEPDDSEAANRAAPPEPGTDWHAIAAASTGYVQTIDRDALLTLADERNVIVRVEHHTGEFVIEGTPLVSLLGILPTREDATVVAGLFTIGRQRTIEQDAAFGIRQIVDIALKALSPGINDTTTAVMCVNYLAAILARLTRRRIESCRRGKDGRTRLLGCGPTYVHMVGRAFDQIRQNAAGNVAVLEAMLDALALLGSCTTSPSRRDSLLEHVFAVAELTRESVNVRRDREHAEARVIRAISSLRGQAGRVSPSVDG